MPKLLNRLLTTLCVGLLATTPAFGKSKKPVTKPAPPQTSDADKKSDAASPPTNGAPTSPAPSEASAPSGGGGW